MVEVVMIPNRNTSVFLVCLLRASSPYDYLHRNADLFSIAGATDIHGTKFDDPSNPIAKKGKLDKSITPAEYVAFVSFIDDDQLARFGLHNG